jgi:hypothetical protein
MRIGYWYTSSLNLEVTVLQIKKQAQDSEAWEQTAKDVDDTKWAAAGTKVQKLQTSSTARKRRQWGMVLTEAGNKQTGRCCTILTGS